MDSTTYMYLLYALYVVYFLYGLYFLRERTLTRSREKGPAALGKPQEKRGRTRVLQLECRKKTNPTGSGKNYVLRSKKDQPDWLWQNQKL